MLPAPLVLTPVTYKSLNLQRWDVISPNQVTKPQAAGRQKVVDPNETEVVAFEVRKLGVKV